MENRLDENTPATLSSRHVFRGIEYILSLTTNAAKEFITVEVEDRVTADQWRAQFDARCKMSFIYNNLLLTEDIWQAFGSVAALSLMQHFSREILSSVNSRTIVVVY